MSKQGDQRKLRRCAELCVGRGYGLALALVGRRADAEEIVQETLLIATQKVETLGMRPWPWLAATIANLARNHRRKETRRGIHEAASEEIESQLPSPFEAAVSREMNARLWSAIQKLSESEREVLALVHLAGLSRREAARQRGVSATSLRRELDGALVKLRAEMGLSDKVMLAALPLLFAAPSTSFIASLGSLTGAPASSSGVSIGATGTTIGTIIGGIIMKKSAAAIIIVLLLLLSGGGAWFLWGGDGSDNALVTATNEAPVQEDSQEGQREGVFGVEQLPRNAVLDDAKAAPVVVAAAHDVENVADAAPMEAAEEMVKIVVVDKKGNPIPNAIVSHEMKRDPILVNRKIYRRWRVDEEGVVTVPKSAIETGDEYGRVRVEVGARGFIEHEIFGSVDETKLIRFELEQQARMQSIPVLVEDSRGTPIAGVNVYIALEDAILYHFSAVTDERGLATIQPQSTSADFWSGIFFVCAGYEKRDFNGMIMAGGEMARIPLQRADENREWLRLVFDSPKRIQGRVLRADGSPAEGAYIHVYARREGRGPMWQAVIEPSASGEFFLPCEGVNEIFLTLRWRDEFTGVEQLKVFPKVLADANGNFALGTVYLEPKLDARAQAIYEGVAVEDVEYEAQYLGKSYWVGHSTREGTTTIFDWTASNLTLPDGTELKMRAKSKNAASECRSVRAEALAGKLMVFELAPFARGTLAISFIGEELNGTELEYELTTRKGPYGFYTERGSFRGDTVIECQEGEYSLNLWDNSGRFIMKYESLQVMAGVRTELPITLYRAAILEVSYSAEVPNGYSLTISGSLTTPKDGFWTPPGTNNRRFFWPQEEYTLVVNIYHDGAFHTRRIQIPPIDAGETRKIDVTKEANEVIAEATEAKAEVDGD